MGTEENYYVRCVLNAAHALAHFLCSLFALCRTASGWRVAAELTAYIESRLCASSLPGGYECGPHGWHQDYLAGQTAGQQNVIIYIAGNLVYIDMSAGRHEDHEDHEDSALYKRIGRGRLRRSATAGLYGILQVRARQTPTISNLREA